MLKCESCMYKEFKDNLLCCEVNKLGEAVAELKKSLPVIGKYVKDHVCVWYQKVDNKEGG